MNKIRITISLHGHSIFFVKPKKIKKWNSNIFEIIEIEEYQFNHESDGIDWEFTDDLLEKEIPKSHNSDFHLAIFRVPLENRYFARRLSNNRVAMTYFEVNNILKENNIPYENLLFRIIYGLSLIFKSSNKKIPKFGEGNFTHDETRSCIFDMTPYKEELIYSTSSPILCDSCRNSYLSKGVSLTFISELNKELNAINIPAYYRIAKFIKEYPYLSIVVTVLITFLINILSNLMTDFFKK